MGDMSQTENYKHAYIYSFIVLYERSLNRILKLTCDFTTFFKFNDLAQATFFIKG